MMMLGPILKMDLKLAIGLLLVIGAASVGAEEYAKGHGALQVFDEEGMAATPQWVQVWLMVLLATFAAGLIFVKNHVIPRWAVGGMVVGMFAGEPIFGALGLPFLSGAIALMHIVCWSPALFLLVKNRPFLDAQEGKWYRAWSGAITAVILFSFVFDFRDGFIYISHISG